MELRITDQSELLDLEFGFWLIPQIHSKLISDARKCKLQHWDEYLTSSPTLNRLYKKSYKAIDIIIFASNHLVCKGVAGNIVISFDNTKLVPGFDRIKLNSLIKTINYGTLDMKACPIFTDTFNYFANNIAEYANVYYNF